MTEHDMTEQCKTWKTRQDVKDRDKEDMTEHDKRRQSMTRLDKRNKQ